MTKKYRILITYVFITMLLACDSGGGENNSIINIPGDTRVARVETMSSLGIQSSATYTYDETGRLKLITAMEDGLVIVNHLHQYDEQGRLTIRQDNYTAENRRDTYRRYVYNGNRPTGFDQYGWYDGIANDESEPISSVDFQYSGNKIVGYEETNLDEFSSLEIGALTETGTYILSDTGHISTIVTEDRRNGVMRETSFLTNAFGQRLSDVTVDSVTPITLSSVWEYEQAPCVEFPLGIVFQWVCVQTTN